MRSGEIVERVLWELLFGVAMLSSLSAEAAGVDVHDAMDLVYLDRGDVPEISS